MEVDFFQTLDLYHGWLLIVLVHFQWREVDMKYCAIKHKRHSSNKIYVQLSDGQDKSSR